MLGIADRSKILDLLQFIFKGDQNNTAKQLREMIEEGIEPQNFLNDLLEIIYFLIQKKNIGSFESDLSISESEIEKINLISKDIEVSTLMIFWQFILKGLDELSIVGNQILSLEMLITRLIHLKDMPSYETIVNTLSNNNLNATEENIFVSQDKKIDLKEKNKINEKAKEQIKNTLQTKPELVTSNNADLSQKTIPNTISSFESLIKVSSEKKEIELKYDLVNNVNLIRFSQGKIDISFNENLSKNFV